MKAGMEWDNMKMPEREEESVAKVIFVEHHRYS